MTAVAIKLQIKLPIQITGLRMKTLSNLIQIQDDEY